MGDATAAEDARAITNAGLAHRAPSPISQLNASSAGRRRGRSGRSPGFPRQQGAGTSSLVCAHWREEPTSQDGRGSLDFANLGCPAPPVADWLSGAHDCRIATMGAVGRRSTRMRPAPRNPARSRQDSHVGGTSAGFSCHPDPEAFRAPFSSTSTLPLPTGNSQDHGREIARTRSCCRTQPSQGTTLVVPVLK